MDTVGGACKLEAWGAEAKAPPSMVGKVLCFKSANTAYVEARESYGFSQVAKSPGNRVDNNIGYCCAVLILTNSIAIFADGAKGPPFSTDGRPIVSGSYLTPLSTHLGSLRCRIPSPICM